MKVLSGRILVAGLLFGVVGDLLFNGVDFGLNVLLWIAALAVVSHGLARSDEAAEPAPYWLVGVGVFFAACVAWRASPFLLFWNCVAVLASAVTIAVHARGRIARAWLADYLKGAGGLLLTVIGGLAAAAAAAPWPAPGGDAAAGARVRASVVGAALAIPVVLVFGALLTSADPVLHTFVHGLFEWDPSLIIRHILIWLFCAWLAAGWLREVTAKRQGRASSPTPPPRTFGLIEIAVPLGALTVLLAAFIGLQGRYLFGGDAFVQSTGFTYAEFARRGFFELVVLSLLVIPVLYGAQWVIDRGGRGVVQSFRALVVVISALIALIMVSALARMRLYVGAYGLSEDRLYATAFMLWIACTLVWFVLTELRAQPDRFPTGSVWAGFAVLAALNALNPDGVVARTNLERARSGLDFDAEYVGRLSADAVPAVVEAWPQLDLTERCVLRGDLIGRVHPVEDWREWTWGMARAVRATGRSPANEVCPDPPSRNGSSPAG